MGFFDKVKEKFSSKPKEESQPLPGPSSPPPLGYINPALTETLRKVQEQGQAYSPVHNVVGPEAIQNPAGNLPGLSAAEPQGQVPNLPQTRVEYPMAPGVEGQQAPQIPPAAAPVSEVPGGLTQVPKLETTPIMRPEQTVTFETPAPNSLATPLIETPIPTAPSTMGGVLNETVVSTSLPAENQFPNVPPPSEAQQINVVPQSAEPPPTPVGGGTTSGQTS